MSDFPRIYGNPRWTLSTPLTVGLLSFTGGVSVCHLITDSSISRVFGGSEGQTSSDTTGVKSFGKNSTN